MKRIPFIFAIALFAAAAATAAPNLPMIQQVSPAAATAPVAEPETQARTELQPQLQAAEIDKDGIIKRLREQNAQLRQDIEALKAENAELKGRVDAMTSLGGSEVHAYCSDGGTSRNTAGVEVDCERAGGFTCEAVSGLCRTTCQDSGMCAAGWTCDTESQQCLYTSGGGGE